MENPKIRVLVVEDDEQDSAFMAEALKRQGYEAIVVNDSCKAIEIAESTLPQVFLLDLMMPPPDGFKLCRILRKHPNFRDTPILIVTALNHIDSKIVAIGAGANNFLVKPFRANDLVLKVNDLLSE
jgi:putative two-component system response regulator